MFHCIADGGGFLGRLLGGLRRCLSGSDHPSFLSDRPGPYGTGPLQHLLCGKHYDLLRGTQPCIREESARGKPAAVAGVCGDVGGIS